MKRESSRFTIDELNQVILNWELISKEFNGKLKITKTTVDNRPLAYQAINSENIDRIESVLYRLEIDIPFKGKFLRITTSETKTPTFEYVIHNSDFSFTISNEDYFERFLKLFGSNELQVGDFDFDKKYLLDTNNKSKLQSFLDIKIRDWLKEQSICFFDLNTPKSKNKLSLYFTINEFSLRKIRKQIEMFKYCIERI